MGDVSNFRFPSSNANAAGCTGFDDLLWVVDKVDRKTYVYDLEGNRQTSREFNLHSTNTSPNGITYGNSHFWVADTNLKVYKYTAAGAYVSEFDLYDNAEIHGITYNEGQIWVLDRNGLIHSYIENGTFRESHRLDKGNAHPEGITFHNGHLHVVDADDGKVYVYNLGIIGTRVVKKYSKINTPYPRALHQVSTVNFGALSQNRPIPE